MNPIQILWAVTYSDIHNPEDDSGNEYDGNPLGGVMVFTSRVQAVKVAEERVKEIIDQEDKPPIAEHEPFVKRVTRPDRSGLDHDEWTIEGQFTIYYVSVDPLEVQ